MEPLLDSERHNGKSESPISLPSNHTQAMETPLKFDKSHLSIYEDGRIKYRNDAERIWTEREIPRILSTSESMDLIARSFGLTSVSGPLEPVIFVSIDFEAQGWQYLWGNMTSNIYHGLDTGPRGVFQSGVAILDTRDLEKSQPIPTYQAFHATFDKQFPMQSSNYRFGVSERNMDVKSFLDQFLLARDDKDQPRQIVLVGQSIEIELLMMLDHGIDLRDRQTYPGVLGVMDTWRLAQAILPQGPYYLEGILKNLAIPYGDSSLLHVGAHDAHFTLKALLMLFVRNVEGKELSRLDREKVETVQRIAQDSIDVDIQGLTPDQLLWEADRVEKKERRRLKKEKMQMQRTIRHEMTANNIPRNVDWIGGDDFDLCLFDEPTEIEGADSG